uniref:Transmembrane protein n=1 Tax=Panagrellus redivivus TaxID=6233 RepID=A0A7E4ZPX6_PANRE
MTTATLGNDSNAFVIFFSYLLVTVTLCILMPIFTQTDDSKLNWCKLSERIELSDDIDSHNWYRYVVAAFFSLRFQFQSC